MNCRYNTQPTTPRAYVPKMSNLQNRYKRTQGMSNLQKRKARQDRRRCLLCTTKIDIRKWDLGDGGGEGAQG